MGRILLESKADVTVIKIIEGRWLKNNPPIKLSLRLLKGRRH